MKAVIDIRNKKKQNKQAHLRSLFGTSGAVRLWRILGG